LVDARGWTLRVLTLERMKEGERVTAPLDRLARAALGGPNFAGALATTLDGGTIVLAVAVRDPERVQRMSSRLSRAGS
jgi:hypothetical protein